MTSPFVQIAGSVERINPSFEMAAILPSVLAEIENALVTGETILSAEVTRFERAFAEHTGCAHALGLNSGTDAIVLALAALDVGQGDEVITVANTFHATALGIARTGATPVLVDARDGDFLMAVDQVEAAITERTRAVVAVHLYGLAMDLSGLVELCRRRGIHLVEDCAQAVGAKSGGVPVGSIGAVGCFSFHPSKNLGAAGDAGIVVTGSQEIAERVRGLRYFGQRQRKVHSELGYNTKLDTIQAIVLYHKLGLLDEWNAARARCARRYLAGLSDLPVSFQATGDSHVYHLFQVRTDRRDDLLAHLKERGIDAVVRYPVPIHLQPAFAGLGQGPGSFPVAERLAAELLCLPVRPDLEGPEQDLVIDAVRGFFGGAS